ncbi:MAG: hypothetical protein AVDCRST_MAG72-2018 [uncultured Nocardioidaceae bacterium]|uniref:Uncharacterized protein n=1 Tax=uncultured Nocardioidaceae bacterium TaxID=253824 RepID=A0A6J4MG85_9ACTN|nr:MAG: hypothetical protein AVDCRST_MAG72-2018 [uncultured Nocardioidaceae bacterium]
MGEQVVVSMPTIDRQGQHSLVSADVEMPGHPPVHVWYRCPVEEVSPAQAVDAFFVLALVPAMRRNARLLMPAAVSRDLLRGAETFQDLFVQWFPGEMSHVVVEAPVRSDAPELPVGRGLACCFTGGVDSFYSTLRPPEPLSRLLFVHGFDIPLRATGFRSKVSRRLRTAARQLDIPLLEVETNLRELTDPHGHWPLHIHGSALASVGILLADQIGGLLIPSHAGSKLITNPHGSHQLTDRLHGTEYFSVDHHGSGVHRMAKSKAVVEHPVGARHLRVCFKTRRALNCGTCFKCRRTLLDLHALRLRGKVKTFGETPGRQELMQTILIDDRNPLVLAEDTRDYIRATGGPRDIERAFTRAIDIHALDTATDSLLAVLPRVDGDDPHARATLERLATQFAARGAKRRLLRLQGT